MTIKFLKEWARTFFFIFGILQMLLAVSTYFWGSFIVTYDVVLMLLVSAILTTCYFVITSDPVASRRALILRIVGCSIPFALAAYILAFTYGFQDLLVDNLDIFYQPLIPTKTRLLIQSIASFASIIFYFGIFLLISIRHQKQGKLYNSALDAYKKAEE